MTDWQNKLREADPARSRAGFKLMQAHEPDPMAGATEPISAGPESPFKIRALEKLNVPTLPPTGTPLDASPRPTPPHMGKAAANYLRQNVMGPDDPSPDVPWQENFGDQIGEQSFFEKSVIDAPKDIEAQMAYGEIDAFHGGPAQFRKFSNKFTGSGEGGQAFGWGLYFSEAQEITKGNYVKAIAPDRFRGMDIGSKLMFLQNKMDALPVNSERFRKLQEEYMVVENIATGWTKGKILNHFDNNEFLDSTRKLARSVRSKEVATPAHYKVKLHPGRTDENWLDWDKPVKENQKELIINIFDDIINKTDYHTASELDRNFDHLAIAALRGKHPRDKSYIPTGQEIYNDISDVVLMAHRNKTGKYDVNSQKVASELLNKAGIDGIRYPVGSLSDMKDAGLKNYVIFDAKGIEIMEGPGKNALFRPGYPKGEFRQLAKGAKPVKN